jgi:tetratricopeptide (TPR) repeat protein
VAKATLQQLAGLVNKSFLVRDLETGRFEIHELLRQYVQERLDTNPVESDEVREKHAAYFAVFIQTRREALKGAEQMQALIEIEADIENVRRAWRYYLSDKNIRQMKKFVFGLWQVYRTRWWNHAGMVLFGEAAKALEGEKDEEIIVFQATAKAYQSYYMAWLGLAKQGYALAEESLPVLEDGDQKEALVLAYSSMTVNAYMLNRYPEVYKVITRLLEIVREVGDQWLTGFALFTVGMGELVMGNYDRARKVAQEHMVICDELGDAINSTTPLIVLGHAALAQGEYQEARRMYMHCLEIAEEVGYHYSCQTASKYLGNVELLLGDLAAAEKYLVQGLAITRQIGFVRDIVVLIYEFAQLRAEQGRSVEAVELLGLVVAHPASDQKRWLEGRVRDSAKDLLAELEGDLSRDEFGAALRRGEEMGLDEVVAELIGQKSWDKFS